MNRGAQVDSRCKDEERTTLHMAIQNQSVECVRILIEGGCDVNKKVTIQI